MRAGNHVDAHQFADAAGRGRTRVRCGLDCADVAAHLHDDQAGADEFLADQDHVGGLDHGVGGLDCADQTLCFNETQGLHVASDSGERFTVAQFVRPEGINGRTCGGKSGSNERHFPRQDGYTVVLRRT